jgi:hypothetical protein
VYVTVSDLEAVKAGVDVIGLKVSANEFSFRRLVGREFGFEELGWTFKGDNQNKGSNAGECQTCGGGKLVQSQL